MTGDDGPLVCDVDVAAPSGSVPLVDAVRLVEAGAWAAAGWLGRGGAGRVGPLSVAVAAVALEEVEAMLSGVSASPRAEAPVGGEAGARPVSCGRAGDAVAPGRAANGVGTAPGIVAPVGGPAGDLVDDVEAVLSGVSTSPACGTPDGERDVRVGRLAPEPAAAPVAAGTVVRRNGLPAPVEGTLVVGPGAGPGAAAGASGSVT